MATIAEWKAHPIFGHTVPSGTDEIVGHYTSTAAAASIALTGCLLPSPLWVLNDPSESEQQGVTTMSSSFSVNGKVTREDPAPPIEQTTNELNDLRAGIRIQCLTLDRGQGQTWNATQGDRRAFARQRMWTQYGSDHQGICLLFNRAKLQAIAQEKFGTSAMCAKVEYVEGFDVKHVMMSGGFPGAEDISSRYLAALLSKNADWEGEAEFRVRIDSWTENICTIPIKNCVAGMVLGMKFPPHLLPVAQAIATQLGIVDSTAKVLMTDGRVLMPYPAHRDGVFQSWTDADSRMGDKIFNLEFPQH